MNSSRVEHGRPQDVEVHIVVLKLKVAPKQKKSMWLVSIQSRLNINWVFIGQPVATKFTIISTVKANLLKHGLFKISKEMTITLTPTALLRAFTSRGEIVKERCYSFISVEKRTKLF